MVMMQYAVVEFSSENFEVVNTSTLRGFDAVAPPRLPCESICNWKKKGSKKTQACTVTIHFAAEMRKEADAVLAHLLDGNDMDSWPSAAENKHLGKGCRERKKVYDSESEEDTNDKEGRKEERQKKVKKPSHTKEILARIKDRYHAELLHNTTGEDVDLQEENVQLKNENKNLRAALAAIDMLPRTVGMLEHLLQSQSVDGRPLMSSSLRSPPAAPRPVTPVTPRSTSVSQSVSQASTSSVDLSHFEDKDWFETFQGAVLRASSRAGVKMTAAQYVNDILHGMYSKDYLATHTLAGGNAAKESLDPEVVRAITDVVKQRHPDAVDGEVKQVIRQKCSNAVKSLKLQQLHQSQSATQ